MSIRTSQEEEILAYACYSVISKYKEDRTEKVNGLRFNKIMSLLDKRLMDECEIDLKLPSCWYYYGHAVVPKELPKNVTFGSREESEEKRSSFSWTGNAPRPPKRIRSKIRSILDSLYHLFPPDSDVYDALDEVYIYAPFEFQQLYKKFRSDSSERVMIDPEGTFRSQWMYGPELRAAFKVFPYDGFPQLKVSATQVDILTTAIFDKLPECNEIGIGLAKSFWEIFCKFLRVHDQGKKHVSNERVSYWIRTAEEEFKIYLRKLETEIKDILKRLPSDAIEDPMEMMFLDPMEFDPDEDIDQTVYG